MKSSRAASAQYWQRSEACEPYPGNIYSGCLSQEQHIMLNQRKHTINELPRINQGELSAWAQVRLYPAWYLHFSPVPDWSAVFPFNLSISIFLFYPFICRHTHTPPYRATRATGFVLCDSKGKISTTQLSKPPFVSCIAASIIAHEQHLYLLYYKICIYYNFIFLLYFTFLREATDFVWVLLSKSYEKQEFLTGDLTGLL